ncbi:hypothetical protein ACCO45_005904 [Purpureocillium lilacinum]|uniref:Uncharacterized protein n=1 Tax=Purpureocillium lilacinum TaxID=33203 RepID=A0ACC4DWR0_PURLI
MTPHLNRQRLWLVRRLDRSSWDNRRPVWAMCFVRQLRRAQRHGLGSTQPAALEAAPRVHDLDAAASGSGLDPKPRQAVWATPEPWNS